MAGRDDGDGDGEDGGAGRNTVIDEHGKDHGSKF